LWSPFTRRTHRGGIWSPGFDSLSETGSISKPHRRRRGQPTDLLPLPPLRHAEVAVRPRPRHHAPPRRRPHEDPFPSISPPFTTVRLTRFQRVPNKPVHRLSVPSGPGKTDEKKGFHPCRSPPLNACSSSGKVSPDISLPDISLPPPSISFSFIRRIKKKGFRGSPLPADRRGFRCVPRRVE